MADTKISFLKSSKDERRIVISELPKEIPDFKNSFDSKDILISNWLKKWIIGAVKQKQSLINKLLPKKEEMAHYLGVSIGTVQNAIRYVEDEGYLHSKQRIGTMIVDFNNPDKSSVKKLTSRREKVINEIKKYILKNHLQVGSALPSSRSMAEIFCSSSNTTRLAMEKLCSEGIIESRYTRGTESNWILKKIPSIQGIEISSAIDITSETLVDKIKGELEDYISNNLKIGDRLPAHQELSEMLQVSIKTIHDAMKMLIEDGVLLAKRGRYGTSVMRLPHENALDAPKENSIFANATQAAFYSYQKIENTIKSMIRKDYKVGDKLPAMETLSERLDVSTSTIKKALQNLYDDGYINFVRGKYGGTFVLDIPDEENQQMFKWLAVNPQYSVIYNN